MLTKELSEGGHISPPSWMESNVHYETITGSLAYGTAGESSDWDVYGVCIPPKRILFPHLDGLVGGFDEINRFDQWLKHHIQVTDKHGVAREYDLTIFNIVRYFYLCADGNPNMLDTLYTPNNCVLHCTQIGQLIRDNRKLFLSKKVWHSFKGYAYSQLKKMRTKNPQMGSKRLALVEKYGFDVKFAAHTVRLMLEAEQILTEGDLDLQRHKEQLRAIREGRWTAEQVQALFDLKEKTLEKVYNESDVVPYEVDRAAIKELLLRCLRMHYGSLDDAINQPDAADRTLADIRRILEAHDARTTRVVLPEEMK